ncbi:Amino acid adenylation [Xenorhabdus mauleonii]|uniref:Amino acid adenylation n=1 Tax=Xenorhabdus mauleonii TaxID=351675 RepID=A0A1I3J5G7_9GAMM|nr:non-ribosomal peptide synthetase [Xenorhabdus mauleonii]PHM46098.1 Amino acid adenylation [Xenorhabdus mauleonii]SFI55346.1 amino acid adenylation domain-containing protein [Xenorhabdus mauleonii]
MSHHSNHYSNDLQFWKKRYEILPPPLLQPASPNQSNTHNQSQSVVWQIDKALFQRIEGTIAQQKISILNFIHAVLVSYCARTTDADEIVIALPVHDHKHVEQQNSQESFSDIIPIGVTISSEDTFFDVLRQTTAEVRRCYEHQYVPLAEINRQTQVQQKTGRNHLFDIAIFDTEPSSEPFETPYPLSIIIRHQTAGILCSPEHDISPLALEFCFSTDYFSTTKISALQARLAVLMEGITIAPDIPIARLPLLPEAERQKILEDFNNTHVSLPKNALIHQMFEEQVQRDPNAIALFFEDQSMSYNELNQRANRLAHYLIAQGVRPDHRVAICVERSLEMVVGLLAILKAGGAYVPLDPTYPAERLAYILNDALPVALLTQSTLLSTLSCDCPTLLLDSPELTLETQPIHNPDIQILGLASHHLAYVIYTSGSTGLPKGVEMSLAALSNLLQWHRQDTSHFSGGGKTLQFAALGFDVAFQEIFTTLCEGGSLILINEEIRRDPQQLLHLIQQKKINRIFLPYIALQNIAEAASYIEGEFSCLSHIITAGEQLRITPAIRQFIQRCGTCQLHNHYGPTESHVVTSYTLAGSVEQWPSLPPIGHPIANTQIYILDTQGQPVPLGIAGEIYIAGASIARGYLNRPDLTAERFLHNPFSAQPDARMYKTGDLGRWLPDGNIEYLGRNDFQVKIRGFRIELGEIEARLIQCQGVHEAVVLVHENEKNHQKRLIAYLLPQANVKLVPSELRQQLSQHLADYMLPSAFVSLDAFPLTPSGKLDRRSLPDPDQSAFVISDYIPPRGKIETILSQIWQTLLGIEQVGRNDHFFELGGHSLMVVSLIKQLHIHGLHLSPHTVFATPILAEMASAILAAQETTSTFLVPPNGIPDNCTAITPEMLPLVSLTQDEIDSLAATIQGGAANIQDIYPLAPLQEGILFHSLLQTQGDIYIVLNLLAFDTRDYLDAFLAALQQVIDRHDVLRTSVHWQELKQPVQVVWRHASLHINTFVPASEQDIPAQLLAYLDPQQHQITLNQAPLVAAHIAHDPIQDAWLLALSFHHLISDHMTLELIIAEIKELLHDRGESDHIPNRQVENLPPALSYRDFVAQSLCVPESVHKDYFCNMLADVDSPTAPFGMLDVHSDKREITELSQPLAPALAQALRTQARHQGVSPSVLFHVAWALVLAKISGQNDVVFGTILLGRMQGRAGIEQVLGLFINTLPIRFSLADASAQEIIQTTYRNLATLLEHEQAPLALAQRCSGIPQSLPLFNTLLNYRHNQPENTYTHWEGIRLLAEKERSNYPINLSVDDWGKEFSLVVQTVSDINPARLIAYMTTALTGLLDALDNPLKKPLLDIAILPAEEQQQLLVDFNATQQTFPQDALIHQLFEKQEQNTPDAIAVNFDGQLLSYRELNQRANRLAHHLIALGVRPDERVAICVERCPEMLVGMLAIFKAGGAYVPLDPAYPAERLAYMLNDSAPVALLIQQALTHQLDCDIPTIILDTQEPASFALSDSNPDSRALGITPHHLAYVIYTSGSTGHPKGVMIEHHSLCNVMSDQKEILAITPDSRILQFASNSFDAAIWECCLTLLSGACLYLAKPTQLLPGATLLQYLETHAITHAPFLSPTALMAMDTLPATLQVLVVAGETCPPTLVKRWANGRQMFNAYGPTEATICATIYPCENPCDNQTENVLPIGRPIANTQIYILDAKGQPVPLCVTGEIYIGGENVARGYLNRPDLTAERFLPDPFSDRPNARMYKTGDLGCWLPDGNIAYLGRNDFQIKLRGFRIEPGEIEAQLVKCHGVREAAVLVREDETHQKRLIAYLLPEKGIELIPSELRQQLAQQLADYMLPSAFVTLDAFPLTPNGKLDRQALPAPDKTAIVTRHYEAPAGEMEIELAEIWQELLKLEQVSRYDHFFELGGHSLLAIQFAARVCQKLARELHLQQLFDNPVLADLAAILSNTSAPAPISIPIAERTAPIPLSFAQQRLWFLAQLDPAASLAYHIPILLQVKGELNFSALTAALNNLVARQESLRTRIVQIDEQTYQQIDAEDIGFTLTYQDLRSESGDAQQNHIAELVENDSCTPFDFTHGPLIRGQLLQLAEKEHVLLLTQHHIIFDGWSAGILLHELGILYRAALEGHNTPLLPLPIQYADYTVWQREYLQEHTLVAQRDFWREQLKGAPALLTLPSDRPRPSVQRYAGNQIPIHLSADLLASIKALAQRQDITLFMTLLTGWAIVLSRLSGQDDIVIGTPVANRPRHELENVIGFFVNTLPLRITLENCNTVAELCALVRKQALAAYAHQDLPFEQLVEILQPQRNLSYSPIFQVMLALDNTPPQSFELPDLSISFIEQALHSVHFDITLSLTETVDGLSGHLEYASDLFDRNTVERMVNYLTQVLTAMATDEMQEIAHLPLLSAAERQQLLVDFNATQIDFPQHALIHQLVEAQVQRTPNAIAVTFEEQSLSYDELNHCANRLAHHLIALGVRPDDRVAICLERSPLMIVGLLGILKAGGAYVPLDPNYPCKRLAYILEDSAPKVVLTQTKLRGLVDCSLPTVIFDSAEQYFDTEQNIDTVATCNPDTQALGLASHHLAYVIYTSGSTGQPKGVAIEHRNTVNFLTWAQQNFTPEELAHTLCATSLNFDLAVYECFAPLIAGGTVHLVPNALSLTTLKPTEVESTIRLINTVPSAILHLLNANAIPASTRTVNLAGEALKSTVVEQLFASSSVQAVCNLYGPSETTTYSTWTRMNRATGFAAHIGRPIANTQIYILDTHGQPVPLGVSGEIYIAGAGVARGYLNRPELTDERFLPDPFSSQPAARMYKTGDLGRWLPDGNIEYLGRNDFQVKIRGFRIELGEIETKLEQCRGVREAVVIAREDSQQQKQLVAYLLTESDRQPTPAELRQQLAQQLTDYMIPSAFVMLDTFPLTPNGKLDRQALPAPDASAVVTQGYEEPIGEVETALAQIWQTLLGFERVSRHDHFFELGGHSLLAIQLVIRVRQNLALEFSLPQLFAHPVLSDLAATLTGAAVATQAAKIPVAERHQHLPLSFAQQRLWFLAQLNPAASLAYHIPAVLHLRGQLNLSAFKAALDLLVARQESLRTRFTFVNEQPCQHIDAENIGFALNYQDIRELNNGSGVEQIDERIAQETQTLFDFSNEPPIRGQLLQRSDDEYIFILTQHHIITDGWSVGIFIQELGQLYRAALEGKKGLLPPLPIQYVDYAVWQQEWLQSDMMAAQRNFWQEQLQGAPELLALPTDRPRPPEQSYTGDSIPIHLDAELLARLKALGQRQGTTLFMTLLAGWSIVLSRLSGQNDIVIGTPVTNRPQSELEGIIGFFANTLPLRVELENSHTVAELLTHIRERALAAYEHQNLPFEQLVEILQPNRSLSYNPIFQVMLALDNTPVHSLELPGLSVSMLEQTRNSAHFDLTLSLAETKNGLTGYLEYASDLFDNVTVDRIAGYLIQVLTAMTVDEKQNVAHLPMLSAAERQQLLVEFNTPHSECPQLVDEPFLHEPSRSQRGLIHQSFEEQVQRTPDATAVIFGEQSLSYQELNRRANQLAHRLIAFGVRPDDRVAICVERGLDMIIGLFGILKAGAGYIPLDPEYPSERLIYQLSDGKPVLLLTQKHLQKGLFVQDLPVWQLDDETCHQSLAQQPVYNPDSEQLGLKPHHLAYIIYTSGSTGHPKGVMLEHHNVVSLIHAQRQVSQPQLGDRILQFVTVAFDISVSDIFPTLASGAALVLRPAHIKVPDMGFVNFLREQKVTIINVPTAFWNHWVEEVMVGHRGFSPYLHTVIVGGDKIEQRYLADWLSCPETQSCRWFNAYGPTEITVTATALQIDGKHALPVTDNIPIGRPLSNTRMYILDAFGEPVPIGVGGEIYIGGQGVARGYSNQPKLTAERFVFDPFSEQPNARMYKTGDLGRWRADGNIEFLGRNDFQVKIRGFRIELGEVETRLMQCNGVREAIVLAREMPVQKGMASDKRLIAYLLAKPHVKLVPAELRQQLSLHLADYMLPSAFVVLDAFPLAPNGKLDRQALPLPDQSAFVSHTYEAPINEMEIALAQTWQTLLRLEKVGRRDHFFELGGHSLMVVNLIEQLRLQGWKLDLRSVFATPVLADMALAMQPIEEHATAFIAPPNLIPDGCTKITPAMLPLISLAQHEIDTITAVIPGGAANIQDIYPLAPLQEGMLFHHLLQTQGDIYLLQLLMAFDNRERLDAFLSAFQQVINRHDILRTAICWQALKQPVQVVCRHASLHVETFEPEDDHAMLSQLQAHTSPYRHRLDIHQAPLISASVAHDPHQGEWLLAMCGHHILNDHISLDIIISEINELMHRRAEPATPALPYRHFIAETLKIPPSSHEAYFRETLGDVEIPTVPFGLLDIYSADRQVTKTSQLIRASLSRNIRKQARRHKVSCGVLFHVALALVLAKISRQEDVVFGTVLSGRMQGGTDINQIPGLFINTLPTRIRLAENSVQQTVQAAYRSLTQLLEHEQASLALAQRCSSVASPLPLFNTLLNYRHTPMDAARTAWEGVRLISAEERMNYPLYFAVDDLGKSFQLEVQAVQGIDSSRLHTYMLSALSGLVEALNIAPQQPIVDIPIISDMELQQLQIDFTSHAGQRELAFEHAALAGPPHEAPRGDVETALAQIWQKLLKLERVSRHDNFFSSGGHSLTAIQLLARMHEQNMHVSLMDLFTHPTLKEMAMVVDDSRMPCVSGE